jgi:hypothetical protein
MLPFTRQIILGPRITASGDSHHCFGVPIAAIKMLVDGRDPATGAGLLTKSEPRAEEGLER